MCVQDKKNISERKDNIKVEKIFWYIIGLCSILVGSVWLLFPNPNISEHLAVMNFFSICAILIGIYLVFYAYRLQPIAVQNKGITLRERRIRDLFRRKKSILLFDEIEKIIDEGKIIKINIRNKRIPLRLFKKRIITYDEFLNKIRQNKIQIE